MDNKLKFIDDLQEAVLSNRLEEYAAPEDNFQRVRDGWVWYLGMKGIRANELTASDVARMMILFKLARLHTTPGHHDSWVDIAGYAVCGEDIEAGKKEKTKPTTGLFPNMSGTVTTVPLRNDPPWSDAYIKRKIEEADKLWSLKVGEYERT